MKFRRGTCGLCKPTKRYKTNAMRRSQHRKKEIQEEVAGKIAAGVTLRERNK